MIPEDKAAQSRELSTDYLNHFINCSEGTKYSSYIHDLVEIEVTQTELYYERLRQLGKLEGTVSRELHHMITSAYFTAVFETVAHDMTREHAIQYVNELATLTAAGKAC